MEYNELKKTTKKGISKIFHEFGYSGSGLEYLKISNDLIEIVRLQFYSGGYKFCINIGVTFPETLPIRQRELNKKIYDMDFETRLSDNVGQGDYWWDINTEKEIQIALKGVRDKYLHTGIKYLNQYEKPLKLFTKLAEEIISVKDIPDKYKTYGFCPVVRTIYLISIYHYQTKNYEIAKELSKIALSKITGQSGSGLIGDLNAIVDGNFA